jgi:hypothetical protein
MVEQVHKYEGTGELENGKPIVYRLHECAEDLAAAKPGLIREFIRPMLGPLWGSLPDTLTSKLPDRRRIGLSVESYDVRSATVIAIGNLL